MEKDAGTLRSPPADKSEPPSRAVPASTVCVGVCLRERKEKVEGIISLSLPPGVFLRPFTIKQGQKQSAT